MPMAAADIDALITAALPGAVVEITDLAGDGEQFIAAFQHPAFGLARDFEQQRHVHLCARQAKPRGE